VTSQIPDTVHYHDGKYVLTAVDGEPPFDPAGHGLAPRAASTACWRGHLCAYRIDVDHLLLEHLHVGALADGGEPPPLHGTAPRHASRRGFPAWAAYVYPHLAMPLDFTGRLLVAADPVDGGYLNMGFPPAWRFARVHELRFAGGRLTEACDRSTALATVRDQLGSTGYGPRDGESSGDWIDRTFSLTFAYSWPDPAR
jgi:hypothetical protein